MGSLVKVVALKGYRMYKMYMCLKLNDYQENAVSTFKTLREDRAFADVTLVCDDGQQIGAHKIILASASPFFLNILKRHKHPHPLIFMRKFKFEDLVAMLDFLYIGEANVHQENLDSFLAVAEELRLKGLVGSGVKAEVESEHTKSETPQQQEESYSQVEANKTIIYETDVETKVNYTKQDIGEKSEAEEALGIFTSVDPLDEPEPVLNASVQALNDKIDSMVERVENSTRCVKCKVCGKEGNHISHLRAHTEAWHITGVSFPCDICGKISKTRETLRQHKKRKHETGDNNETVHQTETPQQKEVSQAQDEAAKTDARSFDKKKRQEGVSLPCNSCAKTFRSRNVLKLHSAKYHKQSC